LQHRLQAVYANNFLAILEELYQEGG